MSFPVPPEPGKGSLVAGPAAVVESASSSSAAAATAALVGVYRTFLVG